MNQFQVTTVPTESGLGKELNITEERADVIIKAIVEATKAAKVGDNLVSSVIRDASKSADNANELAFIAFSVGAFHERQKNDNPMSTLFQMLASSIKKAN